MRAGFILLVVVVGIDPDGLVGGVGRGKRGFVVLKIAGVGLVKEEDEVGSTGT